MKTLLPLTLFLIFGFTQLSAQGIFDSMIHTAVPFGDVNSPTGEESQQIIDQDPMTKYLDFNELDGMGFDVDLLGVQSIITSMEMVTANDAPERDPTDYEILGSTDGMAFTSIVTGTIPCVTDRFLSRIFAFENTEAYSFYRVNFTGNCSTSSIIQVADVQLFTTVGNAPTLTCPNAIVETNTNGQCTGVVTFEVTANDVEDGAIIATQLIGPASGSDFPVGTTPVVFSIIDSDNNAASCDFTVTVEDTESPVLGCPEDLIVNSDPGQTTAVVDYEVIPFDNCFVINALPGFTSLGTIGNKSYYLSDSTFIIFDALFDVFENEGVLATIRNEEDNTFLLNAILANGGVGAFLIGYSDEDSEGNFTWQSGDPSLYFNWNEGEPNNSGVGGVPENYTVMLTSGYWNDVASDENTFFRYILEVDYELIQTEGLPSGGTFPAGTTTNAFLATDLVGNSGTCEFSITVGGPASTEDPGLTSSILVSPNPTDNVITISNSSNLTLENMGIYDIHGKLICVIEINSSNATQTIDVSSLASGLYLLKIKGEKGVTTKKIIKR